jgi:hypothetical protein
LLGSREATRLEKSSVVRWTAGGQPREAVPT